MVQYLYNRFSEASTWRGIIGIITAAGVAVSPEQVEAIVVCGLGIMGVIGVFFPDAKKAE